MIPFDKLYSWLFKSFNISGETELVERLVRDGYTHIMIIKRSWIFALLMLWIPLVILCLSGLSMWIAYDSIDIIAIKYTLIIGNILMSTILIVSTINYIHHFRRVHRESTVETDTKKLTHNLALGDNYFRSFFNWSITNQFILVGIIIAEIMLLILYGEGIGEHFWVLATDTFVIIIEIYFLRYFRKRMMDLEMDYNIVVPGKIFFVNQSGVLSAVQTIESDKIKTVQSSFPNKIASFFNYGTIHVLTEGDTQAMMGTMSMFYVTNPDGVVAHIQSLLDAGKNELRNVTLKPTIKEIIETTPPVQPKSPQHTSRHTLDTREKIRAVIHKKIMTITLGGQHGAGKSTLGKKLAEHFGFKRYSTGDFMRDLALEKGISIIELNQMAEHDGGNIDTLLDERQENLGKREDNFIIDGRLAFHFIPHGKKVFLSVEPIEAARRIFHDESRLGVEIHETVEHAANNIIVRRNSEDERYMKYYGVHIYDMSLYDIVVDTTDKTPEEVFAEVIEKLQND